MTSQFDQGPKVMSFKQVAKWIKSKGRGKLRNYCTMCARQFRDKKGLKNHMGSKSHLEKMRDFNENPEYYLQKFSDDFEKGYVNILKRMYGNRFVFARTVYSEYCHILHHRHLNSTYWETLDDFVKHLEEKKICAIQKGEKGYYVRYIPQESDLENQEIVNKKKKKKKRIETDEEAHLRIMKTQMEEAKKKKLVEPPRPPPLTIKNKQVTNTSNTQVRAPPPLPLISSSSSTITESSTIFNNHETKVERKNPKIVSLDHLHKKKRENVFNQNLKKRKRDPNSSSSSNLEQPVKKKRKLDTIPKKKRKQRPNWLIQNIIVKLVNTKKLESGKYNNKKARVIQLIPDTNFGIVEMLDSSKDQLKIHQRYLETVIPKLGSKVMMLKQRRGETGKLQRLNKKKFCGVIQFTDGNTEEIDYEHFSKI